eukprot:TRINITY_DN96887_c0_g1_i1.p2 TRINITY_DN96887_c0_g1~~TRINITY_DN96887_c0_g1_i1.p2  ORF type:complete len:126 (-),score=27.68 TRINITY_DN96887_c0_g1_i1:135-512(-)
MSLLGRAAWRSVAARSIAPWRPVSAGAGHSLVGNRCRFFAEEAGKAVEVAKPAAKAPEPKPKPKASFGSRLKAFTFGFTCCGAISAYMLFVQGQWYSEELNSMVRQVANKQALIERRLDAIEGKR